MEEVTANIQEKLKDTYDIIGQVGEGGGGSVYKAYHKRLQKEVVIKRMHVKSQNELKNRQEVNILKNLRNSYLPQVYDFLDTGDEVYTVIDFIPGESFQQLLNRRVGFTKEKVVKYARQLCEALVYLHGQDIPILHGDIKPANIMLTPEDNVCLIDFNISGFFEQNEIMAIGYSKGYAAPEQKALVLEIRERLWRQAGIPKEVGKRADAGKRPSEALESLEEAEAGNAQDATVTLALQEEAGEGRVTAFLDTTMDSVFVDNPEHQIDARSDIYSLGATLYHLLTGRRPVDGWVELDMEELGSLSSEAFAYILATAMAYRKEDRFQSAAKMLEALEQIAKLDGRYKRLLWKQRVELLFSFAVILAGVILVFAGKNLSRTEWEERYAAYIFGMQEAVAAYNKELFEENYAACLAMDSEDPRAHYERAVWMYRQGDFEGCAGYIQQLLEGGLPEDTVTLANLHLLLGNCYCEMMDFGKAVQALERALEYDGENTAIYRDLAIAYAGAGKSGDAKEVLDRAIGKGLAEDQIYLVQGEIAESQSDIETAREMFQKCLALATDEAIRMRAYVFYCDLDKNSTQALLDNAAMLEKAIRELPLGSAGLLYERLAQMYINLEANTDNQQYSRKAIQVFQDIIGNGMASYQTYINLTILYEQAREFDKAHEMIDQALDLYGENYVSYKRKAFLEADEQADKEMGERDYHGFEDNYKRAAKLYQQAGGEDAEMPLLDKIYGELVQAGWL